MYATDAEAIAYFAGTSKEAQWGSILAATREMLLADASVYIDTTFSFTGTQSDEVNAFPRVECYNKCLGTYYADTVIPTVVKNATCEIALAMYSDDTITAGMTDGEDVNIKREKVDTLEVEYKDGARISSKPIGYSYLKCILTGVQTSVISARLIKG